MWGHREPRQLLCDEWAEQGQGPNRLPGPSARAPFASKLRAYYGDLYLDAMARCYDLEADADQPALVKELRRAYAYFVEEHKVDEIPQLDDICRYIMMDLLPRQEVANSLDAQLQRYIVDLSTLKESDFCNSRSIRERIYVTTVHKAKGLEYDNVIIFDAVDGRYPNAYNRDKKQDMEDARKFYVALSRARVGSSWPTA